LVVRRARQGAVAGITTLCGAGAAGRLHLTGGCALPRRNPWKAANDPNTVQCETVIQTQRALPADLWQCLRNELDRRCSGYGDSKLGVQWRVVRAAMLLMGDSGLRREEAAIAQRDKLQVLIYGTLERPVWELTGIGKLQKERTVPVSVATIEALQAHRADWGGEPSWRPRICSIRRCPCYRPSLFRVRRRPLRNTVPNTGRPLIQARSKGIRTMASPLDRPHVDDHCRDHE
jgi:integrase